MGERASLIATLAEPPDDGVLAALPRSVDWLELRADLCGEIPAAWLRERFPGRLLYTLRSRGEGGAFEGSLSRRRQRLAAAAADFDWVDLEAERDLTDPLLRGGAGREARACRGTARDARHRSSSGSSRPWRRCRPRSTSWCRWRASRAKRSPRSSCWSISDAATCSASPPARAASGRATSRPTWARRSSSAQPARRPALPVSPRSPRSRATIRSPSCRAVDTLYGIVGNPVAHSLSPRLHNGAYRALGIAALYVPFGPSSFADFWLEVVEGNVLGAFAPLGGLSITAPYKSAAAAVAGALSPLAQSIDSANTLVLREGVWEGETTDPQGVIGALAAAGIEPRGRRAAVVGCGGAGRAAAAGLKRRGRRDGAGQSDGGEGRRRRRARSSFRSSRSPSSIRRVGTSSSTPRRSAISAGDALPFDPERLAPGAAVVDLVYGEQPTALLDRGARARPGRRRRARGAAAPGASISSG